MSGAGNKIPLQEFFQVRNVVQINCTSQAVKAAASAGDMRSRRDARGKPERSEPLRSGRAQAGHGKAELPDESPQPSPPPLRPSQALWELQALKRLGTRLYKACNSHLSLVGSDFIFLFLEGPQPLSNASAEQVQARSADINPVCEDQDRRGCRQRTRIEITRT